MVWMNTTRMKIDQDISLLRQLCRLPGPESVLRGDRGLQRRQPHPWSGRANLNALLGSMSTANPLFSVPRSPADDLAAVCYFG